MAALMLMTACGNSEELPKQTTVEVERVQALELQVVDNDTEYMRRVYVHVGEDKPADPVARGAGIVARQDAWAIEAMPHRAGHDYFLEARDRGPVTGRGLLEIYLNGLAQDPSFQVPNDHELGFEEVEAGRWRTYYLHRPVVLDGSAVVNAKADTTDRGPVVLVDLSRAGQKTFGMVTKQIVGKKLAILSDDVVLSAPIVNSEIAGGMFTISIDEADAEAKAELLAKKLDRD